MNLSTHANLNAASHILMRCLNSNSGISCLKCNQMQPKLAVALMLPALDQASIHEGYTKQVWPLWSLLIQAQAHLAAGVNLFCVFKVIFVV